MPKIMHQIVIESDSETIFSALTTTMGLASWWIADCDARPEVGYINEFRVEGHGVNRMEVTRLEPNSSVHWRCRNADDDWTDTEIRFEIKPKKSGCVVTFEQDGWSEQNDFFATCNYHWGRHLTMLATYCETGESQVNCKFERNEVRKIFSD